MHQQNLIDQHKKNAINGYSNPKIPWANYPTSRLYLDVSLAGTPARALIDSGASKTIIASRFLEPLAQRGVKFQHRSIDAHNADGSILQVLGTVTIPIHIGNHCTVNSCLIVSDFPYDAILGIETLKDLHATIDYAAGKVKLRNSNCVEVHYAHFACAVESSVPAELSVEEQEQFKLFLNEWKIKFDQTTGIASAFKHRIYVDPHQPPIKQRFYRTSPAVQQELHNQLHDLLTSGLIEESESPWSSPVVLVPKKNGKKRMCIDYRKVNGVTRKYAYPLPLINEILDRLKDAHFVSAIDLQSGFHQIALEEDSKQYTAFTVPGGGLYQFKVLPFGLTNAPTSFQSLMDKVLKPVINKAVFVYMDDVLVTGRTLEDHNRNLKLTFELLHQANLKINWEKCTFLQKEVEYLGFIVGQGRIQASPKKTDAICNFPQPQNITQIKSFLGMCSFYRRFIPDFSLLAAPLTHLTKKGVPFEWKLDQQTAFQLIKSKLTSAPVVHCPDFEHSFIIESDASNVGLGAVLMQKIQNEDRVIAYASRTLSKAERNYTVTERECLGVIYAVETFRPYIDGQRFTVITDHSSLTWLHNISNPTGRLARWILRMGQFDMEVIHRKGKTMVVPDALSRAPYNLENFSKFAAVAQTPVIPDIRETNDPWYLRLKEKVENHPEAYPLFLIKDGILYKVTRTSRLSAYQPRIVVPTEIRPVLLEQFHSSLSAAHLGYFKTLKKLQAHYYWPNITIDVKHFLASCSDCQKYKPPNKLPYGSMNETVNMFSPGSAYAADIIGPLPRTRKGHKYIVVFLDLCTKWLTAKPLRAATSLSVEKILMEEIVLQHGLPELLLTDNGSQFVSQRFRGVCEQLSIKLCHTPLYFPASNPVERYNRSIKTAISMYAKEDHRSWDLHLPYVLFALRASISEVTGFSPAKLTYGRELRPLFNLSNRSDSSDLSEFNPEAYLGQLTYDMAISMKQALTVLERSKALQAKRYNLRHQPRVFKVGDIVLRKNFSKSSAVDAETSKLFPKFIGPFVIKTVRSPTQYELVNMRQKPSGLWNVSQLKPYNG